LLAATLVDDPLHPANPKENKPDPLLTDPLLTDNTAPAMESALRKRGPAPKIQQQLEQIEALLKAKQRAIAQVLESMLAA
jgi:hypothetical protein